ncbi:spore coat U domain-containing protein [Stenotrophomonas sp. CC22-02]|uniref:Csu type fimbrial protein n=1 Tax=Stenotrophomonas sp. CC22-02 TaxID=1378087 RepID=UPI001062D0EA|nr:spore coat U domain-containing protein [Stenotrophomonas sp. CC22-02]MBN5171721.1 spore coat protein U domain-containing protein [Stenotrophomonas maltophilia]TDV30069.1 spore coat protein U-like protein [Stenotrophomonas sp. CC22-02]HEL3780287.1 spore coat protein U domain-containing protein [Stenotrophomonas maltophilia]HEL5007255.1 spore coat protein U domain-containing protein [Stenotrophomonas maltophilia]
MRSPVRSPLAWAMAGLLASSPVLAADTTNFNVTLIVTKACTITAAAATNVDFGTAASTTATPTLGQGTVTAQCSALTPYTISLNAGANASTANDVTTRRMKNTNAAVTANNYVGYQLYQDAAHTLVWGATTGTNTQAGIGTGLAVPYIVYGQILNLSTNNPATGNYLDTVTATITY